MKHIQIENGLTVHLLQTRTFKTNVITVLIRTGLTKENATNNSVLAEVLKSGCKKHKTAFEIARACESLYGAEFDIGVVKKGEEHILQLYLEVLNNRLEPENLFESAGELLHNLLFEPLVIDGAFKREYVEMRKERQRQVIAGIINDKKKYAKERCIEIMCDNEPFGVSGDGYEECLGAISPESLHVHYKKLIAESLFEIGIVGDIDVDSCVNWAKKYFVRGERNIVYCEPPQVIGVKSGLRETSENVGLRQGKLALGARCGSFSEDADFYRLLLFNEVIGGGAHSRLFKNIREKRSLCYYISSIVFRAKSIMLIQAGVDAKDYRETLELITREFEAAKKEISDEELELAKSALISQMETLKDSPQGITDYYMTNALIGDRTEISELRGIFDSFTKEDMSRCASQITFDTAYFLT